MGERINAVFCASKHNDLVSALRQSGYETVHADCIETALKIVPENGVILILADDYPSRGTELSIDTLKHAREMGVKLFVEYPERVIGQETEEPQTIVFECVVAPDGFFGSMEKDSILMINGCWYRSFCKKRPGLLYLGKVAGFDTLAFDRPEEYHTMLDWLDNRKDVLIAASSLSSFITGRYAPTSRWRVLWETLLLKLGLGRIDLRWEADVYTEADEKESLSAESAHLAWRRNVEWMRSWMIGKSSPDVSVFEGFESAIDYSGRQSIRTCIRTDCMGETAMELIYGWKQTGNPELKKISAALLDRVLTPHVFNHIDHESSMYGLNNWFERGEIFYGDDNARMLLGAIAVRSLTGEKRWDERILRCVLGNLRTSDKNGLRHPRLEASSFRDHDWMYYYNEEIDIVAPHYQAYLWAAFLWMYALTGIEELLGKSEKAISMVMDRFPNQLKWQNSLTGEIARMLLPVCFLVRVHPTERNRSWLKQVVDALIEYQETCGAIRDAFGDLSLGKYPPPKSNENYGTTEASLIQENGNPITDLLYTTNWAFIGLWEASLLMKEDYVKRAYEKLRDFLIRIQVRSKVHPELDGSWMRSFDYEKWEYWGSAADIGWSVWSVETGWVNAWIATTLILEERGESLMELSSKEDFSAIAEKMYKEMMTPRPTMEKTQHLVAKMAGSAE